MILMQVACEQAWENPGVERLDQNFGGSRVFCGEHAWQAARTKTFDLTENEGDVRDSLRQERGEGTRSYNRRDWKEANAFCMLLLALQPTLLSIYHA